MMLLPSSPLGAVRAGFAALVVMLLGACGSTETPVFERAATAATDSLVAQTQKIPLFVVELPFLADIQKMVSKAPAGPRSGIVIDPMLDTATGEQTATTLLLEQRVTERIANRFDEFEFLPFQAANLHRARYLLTGTLTRVAAQQADQAVRIDLAMTDLKSGVVVAHASSRARDEHLDNTPLRYYKDSPILLKDKVVEGYARTTTSVPGTKADAYYLTRIAAASGISEATSLYNAERYQEALGQYRSVLSTPEGEQLRTLSGIYLTNVKLGKSADAESAFAKVVALGFAYKELGVKFLFNPGSTAFWSDSRISGAYPMWLRQIARESVAANACMNIVGHTSRSGPAQVNDALSLKRAAYVRQRLESVAPSLGPRTKAVGMGSQQNIVGSGSDDSFDVLDRRVEFKIVPCG